MPCQSQEFARSCANNVRYVAVVVRKPPGVDPAPQKSMRICPLYSFVTGLIIAEIWPDMALISPDDDRKSAAASCNPVAASCCRKLSLIALAIVLYPRLS